MSKEDKNSQGKIVWQERDLGEFSRTVLLPQPVRSDEMKSSFEDGVLTLTIPRA